jgi:hypothetical protein
MRQQLQGLQQQTTPPPVRTGVPAVGHVNFDKTLASPGSLYKDRPAGSSRTKKLKKNLRKTRRRKTVRRVKKTH